MPLLEADWWEVNGEDIDGGKGTLKKGLKVILVNASVLQYCMASAYNYYISWNDCNFMVAILKMKDTKGHCPREWF